MKFKITDYSAEHKTGTFNLLEDGKKKWKSFKKCLIDNDVIALIESNPKEYLNKVFESDRNASHIEDMPLSLVIFGKYEYVKGKLDPVFVPQTSSDKFDNPFIIRKVQNAVHYVYNRYKRKSEARTVIIDPSEYNRVQYIPLRK